MKRSWLIGAGCAGAMMLLGGCAHHSNRRMTLRKAGERVYARNNQPSMDENVTSRMFRDINHPLTVPYTGMIIGGNWGRVYPIPHPVHRNWAPSEVVYPRGVTRGNPVYMHDLDAHVGYRQYNRRPWYHLGESLLDTPWFYVNALATPFLMVVHPPLQQRNTIQPVRGLVYKGYVATTGPVVPAPQRGTLQWHYPFLKRSARFGDGFGRRKRMGGGTRMRGKHHSRVRIEKKPAHGAHQVVKKSG